MRRKFGLTVKDVRKLRLCCICHEIGIYQPERSELTIPLVVCIHSTAQDPLTVKKTQRSFCHPRCYANTMGVEKLLGLHANELGHIRLGDVTSKIMTSLIAAIEARSAAEGVPDGQ